TRMPRYIRGKCGIIERDHGLFVFPDTYATGQGKKSQHVYSVRFGARELWGPQGGANDELLVDVWDDYVVRA
ncbi:MAG: SH3-like domain-containing protein, partial [Gammaproteobacteria bacterium]